MDIEDIIKHETESTYCDFKATQYSKDKHHDFLIDIISFANADLSSDRFIVIGVKHKNNVEKVFIGIDKDTFVNPAVYQQIVHQNVEPDITFDYILYELDGKYYGVFHITGCDHQPYAMKKDFGDALRKGDSFIRKGRHNTRMERRDYERIYSKRTEKTVFSGNADIVFSESQSSQLKLKVNKNVVLPSHSVRARIQYELQKRQKNPFIEMALSISATSFGYKKPIQDMSKEELNDELEHLEKRIEDADNYTFYEENSNKFNLTVINNGIEYIFDGYIELEIPKKDGIYIAPRVYLEPQDFPIKAKIPPYPKVEYNELSVIISQNTGNIRHKVPLIIFESPIRIVLSPQLAGQEIECSCKIFGRNLPSPIERKLKIIVMGD